MLGGCCLLFLRLVVLLPSPFLGLLLVRLLVAVRLRSRPLLLLLLFGFFEDDNTDEDDGWLPSSSKSGKVRFDVIVSSKFLAFNQAYSRIVPTDSVLSLLLLLARNSNSREGCSRG